MVTEFESGDFSDSVSSGSNDSMYIPRRVMSWLMGLCLLFSVGYVDVVAAKNQVRPGVLPLIIDIQQALNPEATEENPSPDINHEQANALITKLLDGDLTDYEQALAYQFSATLALDKGDYQAAYDAFHTAWKLKVYEESQQWQIQKTLAQLAMQLGQWQTSVDFYVPWLEAAKAEAPGLTISHQDYLYLGQSYYKLSQWANAVQALDKAILLKTKKSATSGAVGHPIPESWYRMKLTALLSQFEAKPVKRLKTQAVDVLKLLIAQYPRTLYWRQLAVLYQQKADQQAKSDQGYRQALSALHSAYVAGYLDQTQDLLWMIKLMIQQENFHQAAELIQTEIAKQRLPKTQEVLSLQVDALLMAKAFEKAEQVLQQLLAIAPKDQRRNQQLEDVRKLLKNRAS
jgi:tetratricopeptide (TPR) repeat protein